MSRGAAFLLLQSKWGSICTVNYFGVFPAALYFAENNQDIWLCWSAVTSHRSHPVHMLAWVQFVSVGHAPEVCSLHAVS